MISAFWIPIVAIVAAALGGGLILLLKRVDLPKPPPLVPDKDPVLQEAVEKLHEAIFHPAGFNVVAQFNAVWRAAQLDERGVPDINDGRT